MSVLYQVLLHLAFAHISCGIAGGNMFEPGYAVPARLLNLAFKSVVFAAIGFLAGVVGTATSNGLLKARERADPTFVPQNAAPDIVLNAATWAAHMGLSSNLRYQLLGGLDMVRIDGSRYERSLSLDHWDSNLGLDRCVQLSIALTCMVWRQSCPYACCCKNLRCGMHDDDMCEWWYSV